MVSCIGRNAALLLAIGFSTLVSATSVLATISPCPSCPSDVMPAAITVTEQYQPVSTCTPSNSRNNTVPSCSSYDFVSTVITVMDGNTSMTVTKTDQILQLSHLSTVITSSVPCPTVAPKRGQNGTTSVLACMNTQIQTMVIDASCPFNQIGPLGIQGYSGSGLCQACAEDLNGSQHQQVNVVKCLNGNCSTYVETWVSTKPASTSTSAVPFSSTTYCSSQGVYTIPMTTVYTPSGQGFTAPITSTFVVTTSVPSPQTVRITKTITFTLVGNAPIISGSSYISSAQVSTTASCPTNGQYTIPITKTFTAINPAFTAPITTTIFYKTTVTNAPTNIDCTTVVTVIFTQIAVSPTLTPVSGTTIAPKAPFLNSTLTSWGSTEALAPKSSSASMTASISPSGSRATPISNCEYVGCYSSTAGVPDFSLTASTGAMTIELCESECIASGEPYSGLYQGDCFCASTLGSSEEAGESCNLPCLGNKAEMCGGYFMGARIRGRVSGGNRLYDVYSCPVLTSTSTMSDETSSTSSASTPDPSSDEDQEIQKRDLDADLEIMGTKKRVERKIRSGGVLRSLNKVEKGNVLAKKDFGMKKLFGM
ncbi:hypothetical protein LHYA1_G005278 [Lachnellula hyalina]|uniref:WSC domain-containing protein n=1 Tax=Lachnellula hyalina TaxID=1316788 RepID=A0A8H8R3Q1_9HELO|nr:uncharacterized protein LHYA1_G005278 [Lachnellula hyalina]TVY27125.1 hypothetical protein LHYA1_G005278 [Lachnellula hyalina]